MNKSMSHMQIQINDLSDRTDTLEHQMSHFATAYNELVDSHKHQTEEL